jgi:hypothetical protein
VHDPRALAAILEQAEEKLARKRHPDPYIRVYLRLRLAPHLFDILTYNRSNVPWWLEMVRLSSPVLYSRLLYSPCFVGSGT